MKRSSAVKTVVFTPDRAPIKAERPSESSTIRSGDDRNDDGDRLDNTVVISLFDESSCSVDCSQRGPGFESDPEVRISIAKYDSTDLDSNNFNEPRLMLRRLETLFRVSNMELIQCARMLDRHKSESHKLESHKLESHKLESHKLESHKLESHKLESHKLESHKLEGYRPTSMKARCRKYSPL